MFLDVYTFTHDKLFEPYTYVGTMGVTLVPLAVYVVEGSKGTYGNPQEKRKQSTLVNCVLGLRIVYFTFYGITTDIRDVTCRLEILNK